MQVQHRLLSRSSRTGARGPIRASGENRRAFPAPLLAMAASGVTRRRPLLIGLIPMGKVTQSSSSITPRAQQGLWLPASAAVAESGRWFPKAPAADCAGSGPARRPRNHHAAAKRRSESAPSLACVDCSEATSASASPHWFLGPRKPARTRDRGARQAAQKPHAEFGRAAGQWLRAGR